MSWEPDFEEVLSISNGLQPTFEQYAQQNNYGVAIRPKNVRLDVVEDVDDDDEVGTLKADARAELELKAYCRKFGNPIKSREARKWNDQEENTHSIDSEISNMMRSSGIEREPPSNYRPKLKDTSKSAISINKLPVVGVKNLYLSESHFEFENPYVRTPSSTKSFDSTEEKRRENQNKYVVSSSDEGSSNQSYNESSLGVAGEKYVTPTQLYMMKARRNRR